MDLRKDNLIMEGDLNLTLSLGRCGGEIEGWTPWPNTSYKILMMRVYVT